MGKSGNFSLLGHSPDRHSEGDRSAAQPGLDALETVSTLLQNRKCRLGPFRLDLLTLNELMSLFGDAIMLRSNIVVLHHNLHGFYMQRQVPDLNAIYDYADWVYIDGMPLIWIAQAAGFCATVSHRITLLDCFEQVLAFAEDNDWRVFYFGGKEDVLIEGLSILGARFPSLAIAGHNGYCVNDYEGNLFAKIEAFRPDILFVGLGMPLQEGWITKNRERLNIPVITTCGATMEYVTGYSKRPPAWMGNLGFYGVWRMLSQPKRLWRRYLIEPLLLAPQIASILLRRRSRDSR